MNATKIVPLTNVGLLTSAIERAQMRPAGLPGLVAMYGASGLGKSVGAAWAANRYRAYYVECRDAWNKKAFLQAILEEMGIRPERSVPEMLAQVAEQLSRSGRPLIVDDVQYLLDKAVANILTDLYNASQGTIVLIGEERVPTSLAKLERLHNRVLEWVPAQQATLEDIQTLACSSYPGLSLADDLLDDLRTEVQGCLRRVAVNLYMLQGETQARGLKALDLAQWKSFGMDWFTGKLPPRGRS